MTDTVLNIRFATRRRTAAGWASLNEVLLKGEIGLESDTRKFKFGDGVTAWNALPYYGANLWQPLDATLTDLASLGDPGADRILFWDESLGSAGGGFNYLILGSNLSISDNVLNATASGGGIGAGASNPPTPSTNDLYCRTDLKYLIVYDGTRWLTVQEFPLDSGPLQNIAATADAILYPPADSSFQMWATRWATSTIVLSNSTAANGWVCKLTLESPGAATVVSFDTRTTPDTAGAWRTRNTAINAALSATAKVLYSGATKNGTPGNLYLRGTLFYRLIIT